MFDNNHFDLMVSNRTYTVNREIDNEMETDFIDFFSRVNNLDIDKLAPKPVQIYINSYGGYLESGLSIANFIEKSAIPMITINAGMAASAATLISIAGKERYAFETSFFMLHQLKHYSYATATNTVIQAKYIQKLNETTRNFYKKRTNLPKKILDDIFNHQMEYYFTAREALKYKLIDDII